MPGTRSGGERVRPSGCRRASPACAVRIGHSQIKPELLSQEWLLIEWPAGEPEPTKYWLSTLPSNIGFRELVDFAKLRWRIERDYLELKQEVGLGHFEGRGGAASTSSRHNVDRSLWILDLRAGNDSPLSTSSRRAIPDAYPTRRLSTQRIPPCGPNATLRTRSQPYAFA